MANEQFGPIAGLIGTWEGDQGVNISYDYDKRRSSRPPTPKGLSLTSSAMWTTDRRSSG